MTEEREATTSNEMPDALELLANEIGLDTFLMTALIVAYEKKSGIKFVDEDNPSESEVVAFKSYCVNNYKKMREEMGYYILMMKENGVTIQWAEGDTNSALAAAYKKIEDWALANGAQKQGGCYVATAVYGSYDCPQVWTLRRFRDLALGRSALGRAFIGAYYAISPTLVRTFAGSSWFNSLLKPLLDSFVDRLNRRGYDNAPYYD